ncbi:MAG: prolipoprotein diacylglyceryl transferase [Candidatus Aminicenantes bacterium]|nr:prolipoprotein diacylglyceryl transferase [Candidatus Aminicenantes bacterium]
MKPILFYIDSRGIPSYFIFVTIGIIAGFVLCLILAKKQKLNIAETAAFLIFLLVVSLLGAKLYIIISNLSFFIKNPNTIWSVFKAGGVFYGGLIVGILFSLWYTRLFKINFKRLADVLAAPAALGHSIGRIGCFLGGCCYGSLCNLPWAVKFPGHSFPVHPTQIYESILNFFNFIFLLVMFKKRKFDGQVFLLYLINYSMIRFVIEFFRGDPERGNLILFPNAPSLNPTIPQIISMIIFLISILSYRKLRKQSPRSTITPE